MIVFSFTRFSWIKFKIRSHHSRLNFKLNPNFFDFYFCFLYKYRMETGLYNCGADSISVISFYSSQLQLV
jgi:hypothetical protein